MQMSVKEKPSWSKSEETFHNGLHDIALDDDIHRQEQHFKPSADDRPELLRSTFHEIVCVATIAMAAASSVFLQRSMVVIAADVAGALNMSPAEMAWSTAASGFVIFFLTNYCCRGSHWNTDDLECSLATGALLIPFGHLADINIVSRKTFLLLSLSAYSLLVGLTSFAPNGIVLDVMAGLVGVSCAATIPAAVGILSLVYPRASRRKNIVFSSFLMGNPAATVIGGLVSGELASVHDWKAPFIFLAALYAFITVLSWIFVPNAVQGNSLDLLATKSARSSFSFDPSIFNIGRKSSTIWSSLAKFDWTGTFLLLAGTLLFAVALTIGPGRSWKIPTENATKTPMIPREVWENWNLIMINLSTLSCSIAFYSGVFWISTYLQRIEGLSPFDVAVRLLPQALMGLFFSPVIGLFMNKVSGTAILTVAAFCSVTSNALLVFLRPGSNYFIWVFPSLLLSTVGMDWTMNVGSIFILSSLPPRHHSIGGSLLQTTARLGVPLGLAITTTVWSSFDGKGGLWHRELAYSKTFISTTAFAGFSLLIAPFIRIGKQGNSGREEDSEGFQQIHPSSNRWPGVDMISSVAASPRIMARSASVVSLSSKFESPVVSQDASPAKQPLSQETAVWVICERCGCGERRKNLGDPERYFDDAGIEERQKPNQDMIVNWSRKPFPLVHHTRRNS
ncbi:MFS general substrate transporter [Apiospora rasikravindrae]|uniref:MFS general substrate transporter n=1 Tax=Apiospora rasikravindrae TaxID=990691 RepID=A0ABR1UC65_9PEZI